MTAIFLLIISCLVHVGSAALCAGLTPYSYEFAIKNNAQFAPAINELKKYPVAMWYADSGGSDAIGALLEACPTDTPVIVVYGLPGKDCAAGYSGGGANYNGDLYKAWLQKLTSQVGNRKVIYILEPDAVGLLANNNCATQNGYLGNLQAAVQILSANANAQIYADLASWAIQDKAVAILKSLGKVTGIAINTSGYHATTEMNQICESYSKQTGGLHCIIDTSRNFNGSPQNEWCNARSGGIGASPTAQTGNPLVDYYLWIKVPGESDGQCYGQSGDAMIGPGAGQFFADGFKSLWDQGYFVAHGFPKIGQSAGSPTMAPTSTPAPTTKTPSPSTPQPSAARTATPAPSTSNPSVPTASRRGQCGGIGYLGPMLCSGSYICTFVNAYYSQCL
ncbi:hypothetical protein SDRG_16537 [Saprolegnia diclina VS20]|uniref:CBM1 domain-containing protein n=1 Tax=Saprolegnia diclina (strain VS20) TaxID=1156394 RepID=T0PTQ0_SAPDV|nr:hypothetical protein SDRG_16537 [Saprolegnia diclina VS20]EQC25606.1 hypothetical protein SDRG_16537 [Saprolegnia diclina VS20]|eukprot:XP_008620974.1 hypothetical protein SDRG_16537 [Saprolegnia diclina VS20]